MLGVALPDQMSSIGHGPDCTDGTTARGESECALWLRHC